MYDKMKRVILKHIVIYLKILKIGKVLKRENYCML